MARVEIEERAFNEPRLQTACARFRVSRAEILGYATILWRASQQDGAELASEFEVLGWLGADKYSKPKKALEWLKAAGFIRVSAEVTGKDGEPLYEISGNSVKILKTQERIKKAVSAAKARYNSESKCPEHASGMPYRITDKQKDTINPLNTPKKLAEVVPIRDAVVTPRDIAQVTVVYAVRLVIEQSKTPEGPEGAEAAQAAYNYLREVAGVQAVAAFKLLFPQWVDFTRAWYRAYKKGSHVAFESKVARELRPFLKIAQMGS